MRLTDIFQKNSQMQDQMKVSTKSQENVNPGPQGQKMMQGQTLQGEIVSKNGNEVQIRLSEDFLINARLEQDMNLEVGKLLAFTVKNSNQNVVLTPLFTNTATEMTVLKALEMANLSANQTTITMVEQMMEAGLSLERGVLSQVYRECVSFETIPTKDIVDLHKLGLAVNESSVKQIATYKNFAHQLLGGMEELGVSLTNTLQEMQQGGDVLGAGKLYQEIMQIMEESLSFDEAKLDGEESSIIPRQTEQQIPEENILSGKLSVAKEDRGFDVQRLFAGEELPTPIREQEIQNVLEFAYKEGNLSEKEQLVLLHQLLSQGIEHQDKQLLSVLLNHKATQEIFSDHLLRSGTLTLEELKEPKKLDDFYQKLERQVKGIGRALESTNGIESTSLQTVEHLKQNLDFLHQINQIYTYVQLPIRLHQGNAHGDLYVYSNKKHMAAKDGKISALLHLDMKFLGPVDVYVSLQSEKVSTRFSVKDDEMIDFLNQHMEILTKRLEKRGYQIQVQLKTKDSETERLSGDLGALAPLVMEEKQNYLIQQYAFDVRA